VQPRALEPRNSRRPPGDFESALKPRWLRAQAGDDAAYRQCLGLLAARLRGYLRRRLSGPPDEVEDLVHETTLLPPQLQRGTYDPTLPSGAGVVAIAHHKLVDLWLRRGSRDGLHDTLDDVDEQLLVADTEASGARCDLYALPCLADPGSPARGACWPCPSRP
jgi:RNA polymerase sigma-70 factor, ECF subfamily